MNGQAVAYVESTIGDIEVANRLAHAVLGQSLDELAPQTRRLLKAIHAHVTAQAAELAVDVSLIRFTRRQLREALNGNGSGWGDTQLKVHLARLLDLELLHVHRSDATSTHGAFTYELTWRGEGEHGEPFLAGLTDPASLTYDGDRSAPSREWSGAGRPPVGARSAGGRGSVTGDAQGADLHEHGQSEPEQGLLLRAVPGGT